MNQQIRMEIFEKGHVHGGRVDAFRAHREEQHADQQGRDDFQSFFLPRRQAQAALSFDLDVIVQEADQTEAYMLLERLH